MRPTTPRAEMRDVAELIKINERISIRKPCGPGKSAWYGRGKGRFPVPEGVARHFRDGQKVKGAAVVETWKVLEALLFSEKPSEFPLGVCWLEPSGNGEGKK